MKSCPHCNLRYPSDSTTCFLDGETLVGLRDPWLSGTVAGRYVLDELIGMGGMASVYRARILLTDQLCAVKLLNPQLALDDTTRERFRREAKHAQRLSHPNIIEIFDQGDASDGTPFLVMELLEGESLSELIAAGPTPLERALPIIVQMARALARAHDFEVIHRDLKPENVFLLHGDRVKLLDFGIARCNQDVRLTSAGEVFGTPEYMAPERATSSDAGPGADLYALGVIMFEMLTQQLPFDAPSPAGILTKHMVDPPPRLRDFMPELPAQLEQLILDLLAKSPDARPVDAHQVLKVLGEIAVDARIAIEPAGDRTSERPLRRLSSLPTQRWIRRADVVESIVRAVHGESLPLEAQATLRVMKACANEFAALRERGISAQESLDHMHREWKEGRVQQGKAMDELTIHVSKVREEARVLRAGVIPLSRNSKSFFARVREAHQKVRFWEGRSGFQEPYRELSQAYRDLADIIDLWHDARHAEIEVDAAAVEKERAAAEIDQQIREMRHNLVIADRSMEDQKAQHLHDITEAGQRADLLELELMRQCGRLCNPLRERADLSPLALEFAH
jgi:serine/threonine protein kinase